MRTPRRKRKDVDLQREVIKDSRGRRVTPDYAQRAAEDALAKVRGRPSLTDTGGLSPRVSFRAPTKLRKAAAERAAAEGKTVSKLAREALEDYLVRRK